MNATTTPFIDFLIGGGPLDPMRKIIDRDTEARAGNGIQPTEPTPERIPMLDSLGMPVPEIAAECGVEVADVLDAIGAEYYCLGCGSAADMGLSGEGSRVDGDRAFPTWPATDCCGASFINRRGNEVNEWPVPWYVEAGL